MLKINLLPDEKGRRAQPGFGGGIPNLLLVGVIGSLVLLLSGLFLFHTSQAGEVDAIRNSNIRTQSEIDAIKGRVADHQKILDELAEIHRREEAIQQLQAARTGPTSMLLEISHILSAGGAPTADPTVVENLRARGLRDQLWSTTWDTKRLWLTNFDEENRTVKIQGEGRTADDVGEAMRRMQLSLYFQNVRLDRAQAATALNGLPVQQFVISARVRY
jgi:type IV pilus assembly protein PilN